MAERNSYPCKLRALIVVGRSTLVKFTVNPQKKPAGLPGESIFTLVDTIAKNSNHCTDLF